MFPFERRLRVNFVGQWLQTVSNIKHIRRWGVDGAIASGHVENQHPKLHLQDDPRRSVEVCGDGEEVGNITQQIERQCTNEAPQIRQK